MNVRVKSPQQFHVPDLLKHDYIFVTKQGLIDLEAILESREGNYYRNRKVATLEGTRRSQDKLLDPFEREIIKPILESDSLEGYDDDLPLVIQSESLKGYVDDLYRMQSQKQAEEAAAKKDIN